MIPALMRCVLIICLILLFLPASAQEKKPRITGQKSLTTGQGKPITIQLSDLVVEESPVDNGNNGGNGNGGGGDEDKDDEENKDEDEDEDSGAEDKNDNDDDEDKNSGDEQQNDNEIDNESGDDEKDEKDDDEKDGGKEKDDKGKDGKGNGDKGGDKNKSEGEGKGKGKSNRTQVYPQGYTLEIFNGANYTFTGNTVTPDPSFTGLLSVSLRVRNAAHASPRYDLKITVTAAPPANVAPVITGHVALSTPMETPLLLQLSHLKVTDPDNQYPQGFSLTVQTGANYEIGNTTTIIPRKGFVGNIDVPVVVNDGKNNSQPFSVRISVTAISVATNIPPTITGQLPLTISVNQPLNIVLTHLLVTDPDNKFPDDFKLKVMTGESYSVSNTTVTPARDFSGELLVKVSVHDGKAESSVYNLRIAVTPAPNNKPVITGQAGLKIPAGQNLAIKLSHLTVEDADNKYPDDFALVVMEGAGYTVSGKTVTPAPGFLGTFSVGVSVNDGKVSSDIFHMKIQVVAADQLEILGQKSMEIAEDSSVLVQLQDLIVNDPSHTYPAGFTLSILNGENYSVKQSTIEPHRNFSGNLTVPVTISKGSFSSKPFALLIVVTPVNDLPVLLNAATDPVVVTHDGPWALFEGAAVEDVDDDHLVFAEIAFDKEGYSRGVDMLTHDPSESLQSIFDAQTGTLLILGRASLNVYNEIITSIRYTYENEFDTLVVMASRKVRIQLNDGKGTGPVTERLLVFETDVPLDIPTAFTPNHDNANDTWKIIPIRNVGQLNSSVRVYDKKGVVVFEGETLEQEWDGHFRGSPLPPDVYYYTIEIDLSYRKLFMKGIVSILR